jgi:hypothetical protein
MPAHSRLRCDSLAIYKDDSQVFSTSAVSRSKLLDIALSRYPAVHICQLIHTSGVIRWHICMAGSTRRNTYVGKSASQWYNVLI